MQQPVFARDIVIGKWLTIALAALLGAVTTAIGVGIVLRMPQQAASIVRLQIGASQILQLIAALIPLALFAAAVQLVVALGSRTYKEGQNYLTLLSFAPFLVLLVARSPVGERLAGGPVPVMWDIAAMSAILSGNLPSAASFALPLGVYASLGLALLYTASAQIRQAVRRD